MSNGQQQIFFTKLTDVATAAEGAKERLGVIRWDNNKAYKYVQYNPGAGAIAAVAGRACGYYAAGAVSTGQGTVVSMDGSDCNALVCAGVLVGIIPNLGYGWIQIKGQATLTVALTSGGDGQSLCFNSGVDTGTLLVGAAVTNPLGLVHANDASASIVDLNCDY